MSRLKISSASPSTPSSAVNEACEMSPFLQQPRAKLQPKLYKNRELIFCQTNFDSLNVFLITVILLLLISGLLLFTLKKPLVAQLTNSVDPQNCELEDEGESWPLFPVNLTIYGPDFPVPDISNSLLQSQADVPPKPVRLVGRYSWELTLDVDNSKNSGEVSRLVEFQQVVSGSYKNFKKDVKTTKKSSSFSWEINAPFKIVSVGISGSISSETSNVLETVIEEQRDVRTEVKKEDKYTVGPHSNLTLYRLVFKGPGVYMTTDTISSRPRPLEEVILEVSINYIKMLKEIKVVYTRESVNRPTDLIEEERGLNPDINGGCKGWYVWLVPVWTKDPREAATGITIAYQEMDNKEHSNLARGAGGLYRFVVLQRNSNTDLRIEQVGLYRDDKESNSRLKNWDRCTENINKGRGGGFLYLCWNATSV